MAGFKSFVPGEILSAADLMKLPQHNYVVKPSDTARANNVTIAADPHLTLAVAANTDYILDGLVRYSATNPNGGIFLGWTAPASATMEWNPGMAVSYDTQGTPAFEQQSFPVTFAANGVGLGTGGVSNGFIIVARPYGLLRVAGTAGSITMRWCQLASHADATVVRAGSWLRITKVS
ncbi:hypothetical protein ACGF0J_22065 [Nonomuraea sp. NPDC047897]|uniref:hypothetical protein n=1 Tax=Nonomuraea sp. NPDC047897 TaxID=3364346 RepID=UPI00371D5B0A